MIRVLYITRARLSFSRAHARNIIKTAEYLHREPDCAVTVFSSAAEPQEEKIIFNSKGVRHSFPLDIAPRKRSLLSAVFRLRAGYDILYFRDPKLFLVAFLARFLFRKRVVFEVHGSHEWWWGTLFWRLAIASSNGVIYITRRLQSFYAVSKPSAVVHCNGSEFDVFSMLPSKQTLRKELSLPSDKILVLYAGSLLWDAKDIFIPLAQAFSPQIHLVVVGVRMDERSRWEADARVAGVLDRIMFVPRVPQACISRYMAAADILINPLSISYPGSISSKLYEYLAAGKPLVTSRGGANNEVITHEKNGLVVEQPDPLLFMRSIQRLLDDMLFAERIAQQARQDAVLYTWKARAEKIAHLLYCITFIGN